MLTHRVATTHQRGAAFIIGAALGGVFFAAYFGVRTLDPREVGWILNGSDIRIEYSGWQFFRLEPWGFPPGRITRLLEPVGTSIANMDSIPLVAIALKPWQALLPPDFQYFGAWHFLCAVLQGGFAALLLSSTAAGWPFVIVGSALFLWNPLGVPSGDNPALYGAGWMTLAGLWLYFRPPAATSRRRELGAWLLLALLAAGTNAYVCVMVLAIAAAFFLRRWRPDRALTLPRAGCALAAVIAVVVLAWWLQGYFVVARYGDLLAGELGHWSMNLLAPFNPMGWSSIFGSITLATNGQYEGFVYFGLGVLLLAEAGVLSLLVRPPSRVELAAAAPVLLACALLTIVAVSPKVTLGEDLLFELPRTLYAPFDAFRASGRFVQPAFYLMLFLLLRRVARHLRPSLATAVVLVVLGLEVADIGGRLSDIRRQNETPARYTWRRPLHWDAWRAAVDGHDRLVIVPSEGWDQDAFAAFTWLAGRGGLGINIGEPSRVDMDKLYGANQTLARQLASGPLDAATLYVVHPQRLDTFLTAHGGAVSCRAVEGFHACTAAPRK